LQSKLHHAFKMANTEATTSVKALQEIQITCATLNQKSRNRLE